jgi:GT2 family glycosyltransferase
MKDSPSIKVSVVIVAYGASATIYDCLASVGRQQVDFAYETLLVNSSQDETERIVTGHFPWVELIQLPQRRYPGAARRIAIEKARGGIIAFIDADCVAEPNWLAGLAEAHKRHPHMGIGGAIGNEADNLAAWASFFCEFSSWMPGLPEHEPADIAAASMTYKRAVFDQCGCFVAGNYCSDTLFHHRMAEAGHSLLFTPSFAIRHRSIARPWPFIRHEFFHGRCYGTVRTREIGFAWWKRVAFPPLAPLVAVKQLCGAFRQTVRSRYHVREFLLCLPLLAVGKLAWVAGEAVAYGRTLVARLASRGIG